MARKTQTHYPTPWLFALVCIGMFTTLQTAQADPQHCRQDSQRNYTMCLQTCGNAYSTCIQKALILLRKTLNMGTKSYKAHDFFKHCTTKSSRCKRQCRRNARNEFVGCKKACKASCRKYVKRGKFNTRRECVQKLCGSHEELLKSIKKVRNKARKDHRAAIRAKRAQRRKIRAAARKQRIKDKANGIHRRKRCMFRKCRK